MHQVNVNATANNYPAGFLDRFESSLKIKDEKEYQEDIKEKFNDVFEERFKDKEVSKINPARIKDIALYSGALALTALIVAAVAAAIFLVAFSLSVISIIAFGAVVLPGIGTTLSILGVAFKVGVVAGAVFGALSGLVALFSKSRDDMYNNKQYCLEQAQKAVSDFIERNEPIDTFYNYHKELFDKGVIKPEDINVLLRRKIKTMNIKQVERLITADENTHLLVNENATLVQERIISIQQNLTSRILKIHPAVVGV